MQFIRSICILTWYSSAWFLFSKFPWNRWLCPGTKTFLHSITGPWLPLMFTRYWTKPLILFGFVCEMACACYCSIIPFGWMFYSVFSFPLATLNSLPHPFQFLKKYIFTALLQGGPVWDKIILLPLTCRFHLLFNLIHKYHIVSNLLLLSFICSAFVLAFCREEDKIKEIAGKGKIGLQHLGQVPKLFFHICSVFFY